MGCILCDDWVLLRAASSRQQWQAKAAPSFFFCGGFALSLCSLCCERMHISYAYLYIMTYVCNCNRFLFYAIEVCLIAIWLFETGR